jgi:hypothetical protein
VSNFIAGHTFIETISGRVCRYCDKRWTDLMGADESAINQSGWAHQGVLIERELEEIRAEKERVWALVMEAATT